MKECELLPAQKRQWPLVFTVKAPVFGQSTAAIYWTQRTMGKSGIKGNAREREKKENE